MVDILGSHFLWKSHLDKELHSNGQKDRSLRFLGFSSDETVQNHPDAYDYSWMKNSSMFPGIGLSCKKIGADNFVMFFCETDEYKCICGFGCGQYLRRIKPLINFHCPVHGMAFLCNKKNRQSPLNVCPRQYDNKKKKRKKEKRENAAESIKI